MRARPRDLGPGALNQLMSIQHNLELLRSRVAEVEDLSRRPRGSYRLESEVLKSVLTVHHVREFMHRIITKEGRIGVSGGVIGEALRDCQVRLDQCVAGIANLDSRVRNQELNHEVSEREEVVRKFIKSLMEDPERDAPHKSVVLLQGLELSMEFR